eukprot:CAMPEP_0184522564 /NCGR_PEP_ID=MMETSP0198_2-20121128/8349_1 /TAXON_ID=1112570 /ORGANISM="Thraustochytrium sp., Strain LLF1b" /LENGTH=201 /DNA_ID=CAMNT_0026913399 /DNA_START=295 /DNA_END=900 /DNA_ORIENTATION=-
MTVFLGSAKTHPLVRVEELSTVKIGDEQEVGAGLPGPKRPKRHGRTATTAVFKAQGSVEVQGILHACIVKVDAVMAQLSVTVPALHGSKTFQLTSENFTLDVIQGKANSVMLRIFDDADQELEAIGLHFRDAYCTTRIIFTLYAIRANATLSGLCFLCSACVAGSSEHASADTSFCKCFFELHATELAYFFPGRASFLMLR